MISSFTTGVFGDKTRIVMPQTEVRNMNFDANWNSWSSWFRPELSNSLRFWDHSASGW